MIAELEGIAAAALLERKVRETEEAGRRQREGKVYPKQQS